MVRHRVPLKRHYQQSLPARRPENPAKCITPTKDVASIVEASHYKNTTTDNLEEDLDKPHGFMAGDGSPPACRRRP